MNPLERLQDLDTAQRHTDMLRKAFGCDENSQIIRLDKQHNQMYREHLAQDVYKEISEAIAHNAAEAEIYKAIRIALK